MPTLSELAQSHTDLDSEDVEWLQLLMADWQILADLSFADLVLWLPDKSGNGFWAAGQMRPTTGPTAYVDDIVGMFVPKGRHPPSTRRRRRQRSCARATRSGATTSRCGSRPSPYAARAASSRC